MDCVAEIICLIRRRTYYVDETTPGTEPIDDRGSKLELIHEGPSGYRHYLDGKAVCCGTLLEIRTDGGWQTGRYEWSCNPDSQAFLVTDTDADEAITLDTYSLLRWPYRA